MGLSDPRGTAVMSRSNRSGSASAGAGETDEAVVDLLVEEECVGSDRLEDGAVSRPQQALATVLHHHAAARHLNTQGDGRLLIFPGEPLRPTDRDRGRPRRTDPEGPDGAESYANGDVLSRRAVVDVDCHHGFPHRVPDHFLPVLRRYERGVQDRAHEADLRPRRSQSRPGSTSARSPTRPPRHGRFATSGCRDRRSLYDCFDRHPQGSRLIQRLKPCTTDKVSSMNDKVRSPR